MNRFTVSLAALATGMGASLSTFAASPAGDDWKNTLVSPVANPIFFESPQITTEVRPIYMYHNLNDDFVTAGGNVEVFALQLRYALTDRLAIIATKDGYIALRPNAVLPHSYGWADLAAGVKYALIDDAKAQFMLTPGVKIEIPTGNERVFQGHGSGEWDLFVSAVKGWGRAHAMASVGVRIPNDFSENTSQAHYSLQLDYYTCRWFVPFVSFNGYTVLSEGDGLALGSEGYDLINFGTSNAKGNTQVVLGAGLRSRVLKNLDLGFAYEFGVTDSTGIFADRFTADAIIHF